MKINKKNYKGEQSLEMKSQDQTREKYEILVVPKDQILDVVNNQRLVAVKDHKFVVVKDRSYVVEKPIQDLEELTTNAFRYQILHIENRMFTQLKLVEKCY